MAEAPRGLSYLLGPTRPEDSFTPEDLSEDQRAMGAVAEGFAREEVVPKLHRIDGGERALVPELLRRCGELGLLGLDVPEEYGGLDLPKTTAALISEKLGATSSFGVAYMAHTGISTLPLVYYGTEEQKRRYLPGLCTGELPGAYGLTEPGSGSDALGMRTVATRTPDGGYALEGTKQFITNGGFAKLFTIFARVDREHVTAFLLEAGTPGLTPGAEEKKMGIKGSSTTQIILEGAKVPPGGLLGEVGKGHKIAFNVLNVGRFKLGAIAMGGAKEALGEGLRYANLRKQFGVPIATFGAIREKVSVGVAQIYATEAVAYRIAGLIDARLAGVEKGKPGASEAVQAGIEEYAAECALAKVHCSEVLAQVADDAVQIHGGYGFTQEYLAERYYRDERINRIFEGTNEINRLLIPVTLLRRAQKGELPLGPALGAARQPPPAPGDGPTARERAAAEGMKRAFLLCAAAAADRFGPRLKDEQEVLLALADVAIQAFAAESAALRAAKAAAAGASAAALHAAAALVATAEAAEVAGAAARRAAYLTLEGPAATALADAASRAARYEAHGLREARAALAAAALGAERFPF